MRYRVAELLVVGVGKRLRMVKQAGKDVQKRHAKDSAFVEIRFPRDYVP